MLKKGIFALALFIAMPLYAAEYWIDVRIPEQYQREHIQGAINIPLKEIKSHIETVAPDRNDTVKLYCNSGRQSGMAKQMLLDMGYTHAMNMGGISRLDMPKVKK
ncbi:thiosulfate sulfurtransferase PspE [Salmonella enterica]|nr:thiosulfate sulfurtransferase PspE [Salmonella enterica]EAR8722077.1 thiosulfate sulfurtransferase PspE [Salmonella enterica]EBK5100258.1 thiosulfate sulfurtransferase PspE [Salmonella enterica]ECG8212156.1 thiosulfate sulfurtransferase PspE [Salmonella enterica]ECI9553718.1 thiosulfate sulfurtransferase PspE [Salmonella enterica]